MDTFQRAHIKRGLAAGSSEDEDVPLHVRVALTYSAVLGLEIFKEIEDLEDKDRIKDKKVMTFCPSLIPRLTEVHRSLISSTRLIS